MLTRINKMGGKTLCVQLVCEASGCWHHPGKGGLYKIELPPQWQRTIQPGFEKLVAVLKMVSPALTAGFGITSPVLEKRLKFMEELGKTVANRHDWAGSKRADDSFLRELLADKDPEGYGLRKLLTKEGQVLWVCDAHYRQFDEGDGVFTQL